jgi:hypothetical protein
MGYRSTVAVRIYGNQSEMETLGNVYENSLQELSDKDQKNILTLEEYSKQITGKDIWHANEESEIEFLFYAEDVKWYDGYIDVDFFEKFFTHAIWEMSEELNVEYIRIGEEPEDMTANYHGNNNQYRMNVIRSVDLGY